MTNSHDTSLFRACGSEYWLIAQHRPHLTQLIRQDDGTWTHREFNSLEDEVKSDSLDCVLALRDIYQDVSFARPSEDRSAP